MRCKCHYMKIRKISLACLLALALGACRYPGFYEKTQAIPHFEWSSGLQPHFEFQVSDTNSRYQIFVVVRHTDSYHYNNLWIDFTSIAPKDTAITQKLNLKLGDNMRWLGSEMDDIVEHRILVSREPQKLKSGMYQFVLKNIMREDPLAEVLNVGVRIEKVQD